jgi:dTDP-4-amino-4,6-dideoxygalactose transaminase
VFDFYTAALVNKPWAILPDYNNGQKETSYHLYLLRVKDASEEQRDLIMQKIFEKGVSVNVHFQPLPMLSAYKQRGYKMEDYPEAFNKYSNVITLPVYFNLTDENLQTVVDAVISSVEEVI